MQHSPLLVDFSCFSDVVEISVLDSSEGGSPHAKNIRKSRVIGRMACKIGKCKCRNNLYHSVLNVV